MNKYNYYFLEIEQKNNIELKSLHYIYFSKKIINELYSLCKIANLRKQKGKKKTKKERNKISVLLSA